MSFTNIQTALDTRLQAVTGLPKVQLENSRHTPTTGVAWVRPTLIPAQTSRISNAANLLNGLYQVDVFYPHDGGTAKASAMADLIIDQFSRGLTLTEDSSTVHITMAWREVSQTFQQFYHIPVVVSWECEAPRG